MLTFLSPRPTLGALLALTLACSDSAGPGDPVGTFVLREVDGDPLPAILHDNEIVAVRVLSETIRLRADGTGTISSIREVVPLHEGLPHEPPFREATGIRFTEVGDLLEIEFDCPDLAICVPPPHLIARRLPGGLSAVWGPSMVGRSPLIYTAVQAP